MELIKCENGHFYDLSKYDSCPYCKKKSQETSQLQQKILYSGFRMTISMKR